MKCKCGGCLRTTHVYQATHTAKTAAMACEECGKRYTTATLVVQEVSKRGSGARALARALTNGQRELRVDYGH
ncbi:MAG TPA: hypothetical protein VMX57_05840, partial [Planctomycetota bacterium]|nr:hypothetical protein [Planctomycetota bacterium]